MPQEQFSQNQASPIENIELSTEVYANYRNQNDQAIRIGIFEEDIRRAIENPDTIFVKSGDEEGSPRVPLLVPIEILEWYNTELMRRTYGEGVKAYAYVHPPIEDTATFNEATSSIKAELDKGSVILADLYGSDRSSPIAKIIEEAQKNSTVEYDIEAFGGDTESRVDVFIAPTTIVANPELKPAPSLYETYEEMVRSGEITINPDNGASLVGVIEGEEAESIWNIYEKPFEGLGADDPTYAGFTKEGLLDLLKDPGVVKIVNRADGEITTLLMFLQSFEGAPWFNSEYYRKSYPDYFDTNNIFMFPGIVTDETKRGLNYATDTLKLAVDVLAKRGSNILVTFECTEVSTTYIPKIVEQVVNESGQMSITELDKPKSVINYLAVKKV